MGAVCSFVGQQHAPKTKETRDTELEANKRVVEQLAFEVAQLEKTARQRSIDSAFDFMVNTRPSLWFSSKLESGGVFSPARFRRALYPAGLRVWSVETEVMNV